MKLPATTSSSPARTPSPSRAPAEQLSEPTSTSPSPAAPPPPDTFGPSVSQQRTRTAHLATASASTSQGVLEKSAPEAAQGPAQPVTQEELESELTLAVYKGDLRAAQQALLRGADPNTVSVSQADDGMRALLSYARRMKALYPPDTATDAGTQLDRGLRAGVKNWNESLKAPVFAKPSRPVSEKQRRVQARMMWRNATAANKSDVQRAIVLLEAHKDAGFRLMQAGEVTDAAVTKVMKEIPYLSPKRGLPRDFNCQVSFAASGTESTSIQHKPEKGTIECRHFVEHLQACQEQCAHGKFDYGQFASPEAIVRNVHFETQSRISALVFTAAEAHLFRNRDFGRILVEQLTKMKAQGQPRRLMALVSTGHVMSLRLRIKPKDGKERFVATFFDPEATTTHVRAASDGLSAFETLEMKSFIAEQANYEDYYSEHRGRDPKVDGLTTMFVRPMPQERHAIAQPAKGAVANRSLTSCVGDKDVDATALCHMLNFGFAGDLRRLKSDLASRPQQELVDVLANTDSYGTPGLCSALQEGHADAVRAYGELLGLVEDPDVRADIVDVANPHGDPGLCLALQEGHADAVRAFGEILKPLPEDRRAGLVAATSAKGVPGYILALFARKSEAIRALGELFAFVPPHGLDELRAEYKLLPDDLRQDLGLALREVPSAVRDAFRKLRIGLRTGSKVQNLDNKSRRLT